MQAKNKSCSESECHYHVAFVRAVLTDRDRQVQRICCTQSACRTYAQHQDRINLDIYFKNKIKQSAIEERGIEQSGMEYSLIKF